MKLTILDGNAVNPGDAPWDEFNTFATLSIFPRTAEGDVVSHIGDSDGILLNKIIITKEILDKCPHLKYIGVLATGYNVVDLDACQENGVTVTNIPAYSTQAVAQHTFALILHFSNAVALHNKLVHDGGWVKSKDFCYWSTPLIELAGKTLGILGYGNIGRTVAAIAQSFGMNVLVVPRVRGVILNIETHNSDSGSTLGSIKEATFDEMLKKSDFVTLHAPLTKDTNHIIDSRALDKMKKSAYLINTARGSLVDERALSLALEHKMIAGYACDVLEAEPMKEDCILLTTPNCVITPHIAWAPLETRLRLQKIALNNLRSFLEGHPVNVVS